MKLEGLAFVDPAGQKATAIGCPQSDRFLWIRDASGRQWRYQGVAITISGFTIRSQLAFVARRNLTHPEIVFSSEDFPFVVGRARDIGGWITYLVALHAN